jgi:ubiquinone/menaquinone biosynthesis C-methylase UbiE
MSWNEVINRKNFIWSEKTSSVLKNRKQNFSFQLHQSIFDINEESHQKYMEYIDKNIDLKIIDKMAEFGCGNGSILFYFHEKYKTEVYGCDISRDLIDSCKKIFKSKNFHCVDNLHFIEDNSMDICICNSVFQYFIDEKYCLDVINQMRRVSKNGIFVSDIKNIDYFDNFKEKQAKRQNLSIENLNEKYSQTPLKFYDVKFFTDNFDCVVIDMPNFYPDAEFNSFSIRIL